MNRCSTTIIATLLLASTAWTCIWDKDTLADERRGVPEGYALVVTNRWHRHGEAYYRHRLETLPAHLEAHSDDLGAYDDLAVAHERLGDHAAAIAVMDRKAAQLEKAPDSDHIYRMYANRGTFHAHAGRYDEALVDLGKALEINPDAHFGRERFQVAAIRFVKAAKEDPALWRKWNFLAWNGMLSGGMLTESYTAQYPEVDARAKALAASSLRSSSVDDAIEGVAGMLRFGGQEGAELHRCLGDLYTTHDKNHLHLAWWAYHRALDKGHPAEAEIRKAIASIEDHWREAPMHEVPTVADFQAMKTNGGAWLANFQAAEAEALVRGEDPGDDAVLQALYAAADERTDPVPKLENEGKSGVAGAASRALDPFRGEGDAVNLRRTIMVSMLLVSAALIAVAVALRRKGAKSPRDLSDPGR